MIIKYSVGHLTKYFEYVDQEVHSIFGGGKCSTEEGNKTEYPFPSLENPWLNLGAAGGDVRRAITEHPKALLEHHLTGIRQDAVFEIQSNIIEYIPRYIVVHITK